MPSHPSEQQPYKVALENYIDRVRGERTFILGRDNVQMKTLVILTNAISWIHHFRHWNLTALESDAPPSEKAQGACCKTLKKLEQHKRKRQPA
jgi:hypothetical protein